MMTEDLVEKPGLFCCMYVCLLEIPYLRGSRQFSWQGLFNTFCPISGAFQFSLFQRSFRFQDNETGG